MAFRHKVTTLAAALGMMAVTSTPALGSDSSEAAGPDVGWRSGGYRSSVIVSRVADLLDTSETELAEKRRRGWTLAEIAESRGMDIDVLVTALLRTRREATERAVAAGRLSRKQGEAIIDRVADKLGERVTDPEDGVLLTVQAGEAGLHRVGTIAFPGPRAGGPGGSQDLPPAA